MGKEIKPKEETVADLSNTRFALYAALIAAGTAIKRAKISATTIRNIDFGTRFPMIVVTGIEFLNETPRSP